jgi:ribosomal protein L7Ae-like RNA K-turn-binding protein
VSTPTIPHEARRRVLGLVGLGLRARTVIVGVEQVRQAARRGALHLAVVGQDAAEHSRAKVEPLLAARGIPVLRWDSAAELGAVTGRAQVAALGVLDAALAAGIARAADGSEKRDGPTADAHGRAPGWSSGRAG